MVFVHERNIINDFKFIIWKFGYPNVSIELETQTNTGNDVTTYDLPYSWGKVVEFGVISHLLFGSRPALIFTQLLNHCLKMFQNIKQNSSSYFIVNTRVQINIPANTFINVLNKNSFNLLKTTRNLLYIRNQSVPRSKHTPSRLYKSVSECCMGK